MIERTNGGDGGGAVTLKTVPMAVTPPLDVVPYSAPSLPSNNGPLGPAPHPSIAMKVSRTAKPVPSGLRLKILLPQTPYRLPPELCTKAEPPSGRGNPCRTR